MIFVLFLFFVFKNEKRRHFVNPPPRHIALPTFFWLGILLTSDLWMCGITARASVSGTLGRLGQQRTTAAANRGLDERVELLVTADGELQVARVDALHLEVLGRVARQLEHFRRKVLENGRCVNSRRGTHALLVGDALLQVPVHTAHGELQARARRARLRGFL